MSTEPEPEKSPHKPEQFFHPGNMAERVDTMMGVLTQGVVDCMVLATGAFPTLTEGEPEQPNVWAKPKPAGLSTWQSARSAELQDAARLTEASARLLQGYARLRGQFSQDFTIRHNETRKPGKPKSRRQNSTVTHSFSVPANEAVESSSLDPSVTADLTRNLAAVAESLVQGRATDTTDENEKALDELYRRLGLKRGAAGETDDAAGDPPPPPPES